MTLCTTTRAVPAIAALAFGTLVAAGCARHEKNRAKPATSATSRTAAVPSASIGAVETPPERAPPYTGPVHFIAIGGGATPESTEVSLEQDITLVAKTLPGPGRVLFAGGAGSYSVREVDPTPHGDDLLVGIGELFNPRIGRRSRYDVVRLDAGRATLENVEEGLSTALASGNGPLLVYIAAHGDQGETARDNSVALWGGRTLTVARLAELHDKFERPMRMVVTSCFSGGFGELAFKGADDHRGPSRAPRCGLFAGTWDRETSGCDANPDRKAQESYGLHFIHALGSTDRTGKHLDLSLLDFDHDGKIGLLDAHTRARIAAMSLDVPTTTSERYLRSVEQGTAPIDRTLLPEDAAVVDELGKALGLTNEAALEERWNELDARMNHLDDALTAAQNALGVKEANLAARLLERWPVLDDAYHPDFAAMLAKHHDAIAEALERSAEATDRARARNKVDEVDGELAGLEVDEARLLRLRRAYETLHKAAALMRRGGPVARYYAGLLACERAAP